MRNSPLTQRPEFKALQGHREEMDRVKISSLFAADQLRFEKFHLKAEGILLDFSKRKINERTIALLMDLARACDLETWRDKMFAGEAVNETESRPVLHMALRGSVNESVTAKGENISIFVRETLEKMKNFCAQIRGAKKITDIVSIGIGGSDLGARMACQALEPLADGPRIHYIANIDGAEITETLKNLKPETTLFIIISKTFSTLETLANGNAARAWLEKHHQNPENQICAVTENIMAAEDFGVRSQNIFPMRPWIGGRYGVWSAAGLPVMLSIGFDNFLSFLDGARAMDLHFKSAPLEKNMPALMAMLGVWERNVFNRPALAVIPYSHGLRSFPLWLRQVEMESNGKSAGRDGNFVDYATAPVIFGEPGTNAQHSFFQAMHQGTDIIPCDFILAAAHSHGLAEHHAALNANALAQAKAFMDGHENPDEPHRHYPGDRPSSIIVIDRLDSFHLGVLMALYELKVFCQGVIWNINSFDQWGVERGKILSRFIYQAIEENDVSGIDPSTAALIRYLKSGPA